MPLSFSVILREVEGSRGTPAMIAGKATGSFDCPHGTTDLSLRSSPLHAAQMTAGRGRANIRTRSCPIALNRS